MHSDCIDKFPEEREQQKKESDQKLNEIFQDQWTCFYRVSPHFKSYDGSKLAMDPQGSVWRKRGNYAAAWSDTVSLTYQVCPNGFTTFGAALGYSGFIQIGLTVIFVTSLSMLGIVSTNDSPMLTWIKNYISDNQGRKSTTDAADEAGEDGMMSATI
jgi:hypothetical protein